MSKAKRKVISIRILREIFEKICPHQKEYKEGEYKNRDFEWKGCSDCVLCEITFDPKTEDGFSRDICFHIWHENLLDK